MNIVVQELGDWFCFNFLTLWTSKFDLNSLCVLEKSEKPSDPEWYTSRWTSKLKSRGIGYVLISFHSELLSSFWIRYVYWKNPKSLRLLSVIEAYRRFKFDLFSLSVSCKYIETNSSLNELFLCGYLRNLN